MTTEAGYIIDQPNMQKELDTLQRRWNDVLTASEERSHRVDKMQGAWVAYNQEVNNIEEVLEKFDNRLAAEPNVNSTDPQVLEHELALCKVRPFHLSCFCSQYFIHIIIDVKRYSEESFLIFIKRYGSSLELHH